MTDDLKGPTLREQLGGSPDPDFDLRLASGWERHSPDDEDRERFEAALKTRLMHLQRPDLFAQIRGALRESYEAMQREGAIAFYAATAQSDGTWWIPGSMVASVRRPPTGGTLDDMVKHAIREYGAEPLFGDKRFIRFEREKTMRLEESNISQTTVVYLTPVPGSQRRRALQFTASFGRPVESATDDGTSKLYKSTFDLMVSTLRWHAPRAS